MLQSETELLKKLSIADLERANAYAKDLSMGLQSVRSFPQGVTVFGSARLAQSNKYCQMAYKLGGRKHLALLGVKSSEARWSSSSQNISEVEGYSDWDCDGFFSFGNASS